MEKEIARVEGFASGDFDCIRCGKSFHLYFNGGELDSHTCCGLEYVTEHKQIDLVVYDTTDASVNLEDSNAAS